MKYLTFVELSFVLVATSCGRNKQLLLPTVEIDYCATSLDTIHGNKIDVDIIGAREVYSCDNYLLVETTNSESYLTVLSLGDYKQLAHLCHEGRARNEFIKPRAICKQLFKKDGDVMLVMTDNDITTKIINVSESVKQQKTVVTNTEDLLLRFSRGYSVYNDATNDWFIYRKVSYIDPRDGIYYPPRFYFHTSEKEEEIPVIKRMMNFPEGTAYPRWVYEGDLRMKPDGSKVLVSCFYMPYMFIFDTNKKKGIAYHERGKLSFYDDYPDDDLTDIDVCFIDACVTDDYIIGLCGDGKQNDYDENKRPVMRFFNWEGECLFGFYIDQRTYVFTYDSVNKKIIGLDERTETIYEYDVKDYIE